jgi:hypothetical protein
MKSPRARSCASSRGTHQRRRPRRGGHSPNFRRCCESAVAYDVERQESYAEALQRREASIEVTRSYVQDGHRFLADVRKASDRPLRRAAKGDWALASRRFVEPLQVEAAHPGVVHASAICRDLLDCLPPQSRPRLVFFCSPSSGRCRRVEGFIAQMLQHRKNHETFELVRVSVGVPTRQRGSGSEPCRKLRRRIVAPRGSRELESSWSRGCTRGLLVRASASPARMPQTKFPCRIPVNDGHSNRHPMSPSRGRRHQQP